MARLPVILSTDSPAQSWRVLISKNIAWIKKLRLLDFNLAYEERGSGLPLLLIHGYPLNRHLWHPQLTGLADSVRVIAPDLRGHGDSEMGIASHSMTQLALDCFDFVAALNIQKPFVVCGLSMGGYIAMAMLRLHPERIAAAIFTATRSDADTPEGKVSRQQSIGLVREKGTEPIISSMLPRLLSPQTLVSHPELVHQAREIMSSISVSSVIKDLEGLKIAPIPLQILPLSPSPY